MSMTISYAVVGLFLHIYGNIVNTWGIEENLHRFKVNGVIIENNCRRILKEFLERIIGKVISIYVGAALVIAT